MVPRANETGTERTMSNRALVDGKVIQSVETPEKHGVSDRPVSLPPAFGDGELPGIRCPLPGYSPDATSLPGGEKVIHFDLYDLFVSLKKYTLW